MPKFVIERELPGAGKLSSEELRAISQKSCDLLSELGPEIQGRAGHCHQATDHNS